MSSSPLQVLPSDRYRSNAWRLGHGDRELPEELDRLEAGNLGQMTQVWNARTRTVLRSREVAAFLVTALIEFAHLPEPVHEPEDLAK